MDNSEVLDAPEVQPTDQNNPTDNTPVQDSGATVINNMYSSANKPKSSTPVVAENNHADSLANAAMSNAKAKQTYEYTGAKDKEWDDTVKTTTTQSTGANMSATWDSEMKMSSDYTANDQEDYSWNKLAKEMASLKYGQEEAQARYESMQAKQEIDQAASQAWNQYFGAEYAARQTQDKMGWTGGQQTASDLQVAFLQAEQAANMYTKDEMQKYGVETKLGIARMYAEAEQKTLALQYYQDAVDQSIKEAEQTGWYVPAEASEMFKQQEIANKILNDPFATDEEKQRAEAVNRNAQRYYDSKGFQRGYAYDDKGNVVTEYYGIKCLSMLQHEETVRNNKVNEELQRQANNIAAAGVQATRELGWANLRLSESIQNQTNINRIYDRGTVVKAGSGTNWYTDADGNVHDVKQGANILRDDVGKKWYAIETDSTGATQLYPLYNSDEAHANSKAGSKNWESNYKAKP